MPRIRISPWAPAALCALWHLFPPKLLLGFLLAAFFHELGHGLILYVLGGKAEALCITPRGIYLTPSPLPYAKEALCALAGPMASLLLIFLWKVLPWVAFWGAIQAIFNLVPILPLDGGRFLHGLFHSLLPYRKAERMFFSLSFLLSLPFLTLWVFLVLRLHLVKLALIAAFLLLAKRFLLKNPTFRATIERV